MHTESSITPSRDWDAGWGELQSTIETRDVWLLTDYIKRDYLLDLLEPGLDVLEVGCGSAKLSALLAQRGANITGIDLSPQALRVASNDFALLGVRGRWICGDVFRLPLADNSFDIVYSTGLLEHFRDPTSIIAEMARVLKPGGLFFPILHR